MGSWPLFSLVTRLRSSGSYWRASWLLPARLLFPILAALGGVLFPVLFYSILNARGPGAPGWGIPMATDIAFAIGVLALLGDRVPPGLKVFLTALAIVDDIAAVIAIALFYTSGLGWGALGVAGVCLLVLCAANRLEECATLFSLRTHRRRVMDGRTGIGDTLHYRRRVACVHDSEPDGAEPKGIFAG